MFLYPFWILLCVFLCSCLLSKTAKSNTIVFLLSFLATLSSFFVFLVFLFFTNPLSLKYFHQFFVFELNAIHVSFCILTLGISLLLFIVYPSFMDEKKDPGVLCIIMFLLFSSVGSILSSGIYSFLLFFEITFVSFFFLFKGKGIGEDFSPFDYSVYFGPTFLFFLGAILIFFVNPGIYEIERLHMTLSIRIVFVIAFSVRLLMLPLSLSVRRIVALSRLAEFVYGLVVAFIVICSGLIKFFRIDLEFAYIMMVIPVIMMVLWNVYAYRQKRLEGMIVLSYAVQSAFVASSLALIFLEAPLTAYVFWILLNHVVSGFGMLVYCALASKQKGKSIGIIFIFLMISFIGLFPSPGLLGRWMFLKSHVFIRDYFSLFAMFMLFLGLSSIGHHLKWVPVLWGRMKTSNGSPTPLPVRVFAIFLLCSLFIPLFFIKQLTQFFLSLGSYM